MMQKSNRIFVAGHRGLVGSAIVHELVARGYSNIITRTRTELDLCDAIAVQTFFEVERPDIVCLAAARVGGILANVQQPAQFIYENLAIQTNVIHSAWRSKVKKFIFLGSSCIYPKIAPQPIKEEYLLSGSLETTNEAYAIAKIAGLKMCQAYRRQYGFPSISLMPTNLYGPNDNFDLNSSHVLPALIRKFHQAKQNNAESVEVWGSGRPRREFLHVDDLARAVQFILEKPFGEIETIAPDCIYNVGTGVDIEIADLAEIIRRCIGAKATIRFNPEKPDGTPRKLLDVSRMHNLGWSAKIPIEEGIADTYRCFLRSECGVRD